MGQEQSIPPSLYHSRQGRCRYTGLPGSKNLMKKSTRPKKPPINYLLPNAGLPEVLVQGSMYPKHHQTDHPVCNGILNHNPDIPDDADVPAKTIPNAATEGTDYPLSPYADKPANPAPGSGSNVLPVTPGETDGLQNPSRPEALAPPRKRKIGRSSQYDGQEDPTPIPRRIEGSTRHHKHTHKHTHKRAPLGAIIPDSVKIRPGTPPRKLMGAVSLFLGEDEAGKKSSPNSRSPEISDPSRKRKLHGSSQYDDQWEVIEGELDEGRGTLAKPLIRGKPYNIIGDIPAPSRKRKLASISQVDGQNDVIVYSRSPQVPQIEHNDMVIDHRSLPAPSDVHNTPVAGSNDSKMGDTVIVQQDSNSGDWVCHPNRKLKRRFHKRLGDGSRVFRAHLDYWDSAPSSPATLSAAEAARSKLPEDLGEKDWCVSWGRTPFGIYPVGEPKKIAHKPGPRINTYQYKPWEHTAFRVKPIVNTYRSTPWVNTHQFIRRVNTCQNTPRADTYQSKARVPYRGANNPTPGHKFPSWPKRPAGRYDGPDEESEADRGLALEAVRQKTIISVEWKHASAVSSHPSIHFAREFDHSNFTHLHTHECGEPLSSSPVRAVMLFKKPSVSRTQSGITLSSIHCSSSDNLLMLHHGHHIAQPVLGYMCPQVGMEEVTASPTYRFAIGQPYMNTALLDDPMPRFKAKELAPGTTQPGGSGCLLDLKENRTPGGSSKLFISARELQRCRFVKVQCGCLMERYWQLGGSAVLIFFMDICIIGFQKASPTT